MKKILAILALVSFCAAATAQTITRGTMVPVKITSSGNSKNPQSITAIVNADVTADDGTLAISYGTPVELTINAQRARGVGRPGELEIKFTSTRTVTGRYVNLEGGSIQVVGRSKKGLALGLGLGLGLGVPIITYGAGLPLLALMAIKGKQAEILEGMTSSNVRTLMDVPLK